MNDIFAIALSLTKIWSYRAKKEAIDQAGSFAQFIKSSVNLPDKIDFQTAEKQFQKLQKANGWLWIYGSENYPQRLASIPNPPLVVYGQGQSSVNESILLAMIGTRRPTPYGKRIGESLSRELVQEGLVLVSGLARGIDAIAHQAAVDVKAPTVAVVAHGLDKMYPTEHQYLREQIIAQGGCVLSEYPFGISPLAEYFPQRNRIISGLCFGTLVIEAGEKSGTRLTVNHAVDQGREVFAVPGPIDSPYSIYTNELIFSGANMVRSSKDILSFYPHRVERQLMLQIGSDSFNPTKMQKLLLNFLDKNTPKSVEEFLAITLTKPQDVLQSITELELNGRVVKQADSTYVLA